MPISIIPKGTLEWGEIMNANLVEIDLRLTVLENTVTSLLEAINKNMDAIQEHCPDVAEAAALAIIPWMGEK